MAKGALVLVPDAKSSHPVERCLTAKPLILACCETTGSSHNPRNNKITSTQPIYASHGAAPSPKWSHGRCSPHELLACEAPVLQPSTAPNQTAICYLPICPFANVICAMHRREGYQDCYIPFRTSTLWKRLLSSAKSYAGWHRRCILDQSAGCSNMG